MKIQYCSDLHLEFYQNEKWLKSHPIEPVGDILIIAGDTYYLNRDYAATDVIKKASDEFEHVYLIPGNHEYYGGYDISTALHPMEINVLDNVTVLNNKVVEIEDVQFIFSTFWSKIEREIWTVTRGMPDFRLINFNGEKFTHFHFNRLHEVAFEFVQKAVKTQGKKVVITHHLPSEQCNVKEFENSKMNEGFCVEKTEFIEQSNIDYWIYGHSHRNKTDFKIGNTQMVTNQLGYVKWREHGSFGYDKIIEL